MLVRSCCSTIWVGHAASLFYVSFLLAFSLGGQRRKVKAVPGTRKEGPPTGRAHKAMKERGAVGRGQNLKKSQVLLLVSDPSQLNQTVENTSYTCWSHGTLSKDSKRPGLRRQI